MVLRLHAGVQGQRADLHRHHHQGWSTVMYRVKAYDSYNAQSGYTTSTKRTVDNNTAPTITTSSAANLGTKSSGFTISYSVDDKTQGTP